MPCAYSACLCLLSVNLPVSRSVIDGVVFDVRVLCAVCVFSRSWHGWLHHMYDEVPGQEPALGCEKTVIPTHSASSASLGGVHGHVYESHVQPREMVNNTQLRSVSSLGEAERQ